MTTKHPQFETCIQLRDRVIAGLNDTTLFKVFVDELNHQRLAKRASRSGETFIVVSPEEATRTAASRRHKTGSCFFSASITISKHTGDVLSGDTPANTAATQAFFDSVQAVIDAAMGVDDDHPDGTEIVLPAPWGKVRWPEEITEAPADEKISIMSMRFRTLTFNFQAIRGG